ACIDRVDHRLLKPDRERPAHLREPRISCVPVPSDRKMYDLLLAYPLRMGPLRHRAGGFIDPCRHAASRQTGVLQSWTMLQLQRGRSVAPREERGFIMSRLIIAGAVAAALSAPAIAADCAKDYKE